MKTTEFQKRITEIRKSLAQISRDYAVSGRDFDNDLYNVTVEIDKLRSDLE